jgi:hypothetical protein
MPLLFVPNEGQTDERVAYYIQGRDKTIYFTPQGVTFALTAPFTQTNAPADLPTHGLAQLETRPKRMSVEPTAVQRWAVKLDFLGANPDVRPVGQDKTEAILSYFKGRPEAWRTGLPTYAKIVYPELWPGIDLVYYGTVNRLKYEFVVRPGADPGRIRLAYRGATDVQVNAAGQLEVTTPVGGFQDETPAAYQEVDGRRVEIEMAYAFEPAPPEILSPQSSTTYGFRVGDYDLSRPLILDPAVLTYAGYLGGADYDIGYGIAVDGAGNAYVTGWTYSDQAFPVTVGPDLTHNGAGDAFVAKVNAAGTALVYAGFIGGADGDVGYGIAVDGTGNAYVAGWTQSNEAAGAFPVTVGPDLTHNGAGDAFVAKVNAAGTALAYAGYLGGSGEDRGYGIAVDGAGNAYVTGYTNSTEATFPETVGPDLIYNGAEDAFVAKVNAAGTALAYAGYLGGSGEDRGYGIAVDGAGNAYVTGYTNSTEATFPETVGPDLTHNDAEDAFVAKVNAAGTALAYAGYLGGSGEDRGYGIAVDGAGSAYVTGYTDSSQATFPETVGPDLTHNGAEDAFVAKVNAAGTALAYAGYLGGADGDFSRGIVVDGAGNAYVTGETWSDETTFPETVGPDLTYNGGLSDAFVAKVNAAGTALAYAGYLGGANDDLGYGIAVDGAGNAYVTGYTNSTEATFPETVGPDLIYNGAGDAFVAKVEGEGGGGHKVFLPLIMK